MRKSILEGRFVINLSSTLSTMPEADVAFAKVVEYAIANRNHQAGNERLTYNESEELHQDIVVRLAKFAETYQESDAALTAKLLCASLLPLCCQDIAMQKQKGLLFANSMRLYQETMTQHSKQWQAAVARLGRALLLRDRHVYGEGVQRDNIMMCIDELRTLSSTGAPPVPESAMLSLQCAGWVPQYLSGEWRNIALGFLAAEQYSAAKLYGNDQELLKASRDTYGELLAADPNTAFRHIALMHLDQIKTRM